MSVGNTFFDDLRIRCMNDETNAAGGGALKSRTFH
jgi:hypothetical protein